MSAMCSRSKGPWPPARRTAEPHRSASPSRSRRCASPCRSRPPGQRRSVSRGTVTVIARDFFDRPALEVAPELLGCVLEHETDAGLVAVELSEVEAYLGEADPASHAY